VVVGVRQRVGVGDVDLVLALAELALRELDRDAGAAHPLRTCRMIHSSRVVCSMW
jgi:hypothetical protein